jgi:hypothetical protein
MVFQRLNSPIGGIVRYDVCPVKWESGFACGDDFELAGPESKRAILWFRTSHRHVARHSDHRA